LTVTSFFVDDLPNWDSTTISLSAMKVFLQFISTTLLSTYYVQFCKMLPGEEVENVLDVRFNTATTSHSYTISTTTTTNTRLLYIYLERKLYHYRGNQLTAANMTVTKNQHGVESTQLVYELGTDNMAILMDNMKAIVIKCSKYAQKNKIRIIYSPTSSSAWIHEDLWSDFCNFISTKATIIASSHEPLFVSPT
jgi:hypothetical protein